MKNHIINIKDFEAYDNELILASSSSPISKRLIYRTTIYQKEIRSLLVVRRINEDVFLSTSLTHAIDEYNSY